ncbi:growth arrest and DNA damage-inducible proteins-interacting protein 1-like [Amphibalanus amphitrite]|uniref:growth arrest and DNA damage-inducible proteins-interacting protein 1-like n=1 Tax=Amphibalanus amphitrite TaxID=1232801 RepID=UPI001C91D992|nr:growth arrest and DNA damage-inducible proteins-interacting protein 1-like [Amphibalanus amphitrite]XP_043207328.1 growth arrest and DNA damage-inducible proteins-interacting protein 1-like [Amphibalanus amphitrite]XP_043207329.1 growth arrest and DNA damage-inducible proteins-interacting protein 1-like [Amphibalanus amphitrite]XP_043207330.1 growth arrest and DNA damage-inducible proteins-interacting protein 1-like [Amphibalanus amphitrite]XP_043207331.1 growth arrest and DNA damage-inducib
MVPVGIVRAGGVPRLCGRALRLASRPVSTAADQDDQPAVTAGLPAPPVNTNVSGLRDWHYRKYHGKQPVVDEETAHMRSLRAQRRIWALYGTKTGISPAVGWPVKKEWEDKMEYESLAYPDTLQEMVQKHEAEKRAKEEAIKERMDAIDAKMENLEKWKREILEKKRKKERELQAAKEKHDRLIEEVKEYLGFKVDSKDPRFKEILEKKELEEKKRAKEAKKKEKQAKALAKLRQMTNEMMEKEMPAEKE